MDGQEEIVRRNPPRGARRDLRNVVIDLAEDSSSESDQDSRDDSGDDKVKVKDNGKDKAKAEPAVPKKKARAIRKKGKKGKAAKDEAVAGDDDDDDDVQVVEPPARRVIARLPGGRNIARDLGVDREGELRDGVGRAQIRHRGPARRLIGREGRLMDVDAIPDNAIALAAQLNHLDARNEMDILIQDEADRIVGRAVRNPAVVVEGGIIPARPDGAFMAAVHAQARAARARPPPARAHRVHWPAGLAQAEEPPLPLPEALRQGLENPLENMELIDAMDRADANALRAGLMADRFNLFDRPRQVIPAQPGGAPAPQGNNPATPPDDVLQQVISVLPDADSEELLAIIKTQVLVDRHIGLKLDAAVDRTLELLFEMKDGYPKMKRTASGIKRKDAEWMTPHPTSSSGKKVKLNSGEEMPVAGGSRCEDYTSETYKLKSRCGKVYTMKSLYWLETAFPDMTVELIRGTYGQHQNLYVPTHLDLHHQSQLPVKEKEYKPMKVLREKKPEKKLPAKRKTGKGKKLGNTSSITFLEPDGRETPMEPEDDGEKAWMDESKWLLDYYRQKNTLDDWEMIKLLDTPTQDKFGECGCCFDDEVQLEYMIECRDGHMFCQTCVGNLISGAVGDQNANAHCMHSSGCNMTFAEDQLRKAVKQNTLGAYLALELRRDLEMAGIEGLENCPFCQYAVVIDNPEEKLFHCQHDECMIISCRACKKQDHIPKTCDEAKKDYMLNHKHNVEEAMTEALVRRCPGCQKAFLKEEGCNKITCMHCRAVSCYICKKTITNGYAHFDQNPADYALPRATNKCRLWDPAGVANIDLARITEARQQAQDRAREELEGAQAIGAQIDQALDVALPEPVVQPAPRGPGQVALPWPFAGAYRHAFGGGAQAVVPQPAALAIPAVPVARGGAANRVAPQRGAAAGQAEVVVDPANFGNRPHAEVPARAVANGDAGLRYLREQLGRTRDAHARNAEQHRPDRELQAVILDGIQRLEQVERRLQNEGNGGAPIAQVNQNQMPPFLNAQQAANWAQLARQVQQQGPLVVNAPHPLALAGQAPPPEAVVAPRQQEAPDPGRVLRVARARLHQERQPERPIGPPPQIPPPIAPVQGLDLPGLRALYQQLARNVPLLQAMPQDVIALNARALNMAQAALGPMEVRHDMQEQDRLRRVREAERVMVLREAHVRLVAARHARRVQEGLIQNQRAIGEAVGRDRDRHNAQALRAEQERNRQQLRAREEAQVAAIATREKKAAAAAKRAVRKAKAKETMVKLEKKAETVASRKMECFVEVPNAKIISMDQKDGVRVKSEEMDVDQPVAGPSRSRA